MIEPHTSVAKKEDIKYLVRNVRSELWWTQREFGQMLGVSAKTVSRWENGSLYPTMDHVFDMMTLVSLRMDFTTAQVTKVTS